MQESKESCSKHDISVVCLVGTEDQQKLVLQDAMLYPRIQELALATGFHVGANKCKTEDFFSEQAKKMVGQA
jgi:hypothetical protein